MGDYRLIMKKHSLLVLALLCAIHSNAQLSVKIGDLKYKISNYRGAAKSYKSYLNDEENQYNVEVLRKLAYAYQKSNQLELAEQTFAKLTILDSSFTDVLAYSETLIKNKKYDSVKKFVDKNADLNLSENKRMQEVVNSVKNVKQLNSVDTSNVQISKLSFNNNFSDFAASFYQNGLMFSSTRISKGIFRKNRAKNINYIGLYTSNSDDGFKSVKRIAKNLKMKGNYGISYYHSKSRTVYYVVNNKPSKSNSIEKQLNIYSARFDFSNDHWTKASNFPYNSPEYSTTTPYVNQDGTKFYFSSNMPGGYGGFDLYVCDKKDSIWSKPINLGPKVNSPGDEFYPFVDNLNTLFFSSNGKGGLGGFDIFNIDLNRSIATAENLGAPINSNADDFSYIKYTKADKGFFSSNRDNTDGNTDIYTFTRLKPLLKSFSVEIVDSKTNVLIPNVELVEVSDSDVKNFNLQKGIKVYDNIEPGKIYKYKVNAEGYESTIADISINKFDDVYIISLNKLAEGCSLQGIVKNKTNKETIPGVELVVINEKDSTESYSAKTDINGRYKIIGLKKYSNYKINISKPGFFNSEKNLKTLNTCIKVNNAFDYVEDFNLISGDIIKIDSIYFDFNKVTIRKDAAKELDKIVAFMKENPEVIVELYSHTDARGSDEINKVISEQRAKASVYYIISKGIPKYRISGKGFGESKLLNECVNDVPCSDDKHQVNRRTEMKVVRVVH